MRRIIFCLLLTLLSMASWAEERPFLVKGKFEGKVGDKTFEKPFEARINANDRSDVRVELDGYDLVLKVRPRWHYTQGLNTDGILLDVYLRCWGQGLRIQRYASILTPADKQQSLEMNDKDAVNVFTLEVEAEPVASPNQPQPATTPEAEPGAPTADPGTPPAPAPDTTPSPSPEKAPETTPESQPTPPPGN